MRLTTCRHDTPIGALTLVLAGETILICEFADRTERVERQLGRHHAGATLAEGPLPGAISDALDAYLEGGCDGLDALTTAPAGTPFERKVWDALRTIPAGQTTSYGALAARLGSSPRAVGRANGRNPICLIHPCHRLVGADGSLTGYAGGLERKAWLLAHEGAPTATR